MTSLENAYEVINHTGNAQWLPIIGEDAVFLTITADHDRPRNNQSGYDWFGCYWHYDRSMNGYVQPPTMPPRCSDIAIWKEQVDFPDLSKLDWEGCSKADLEKVDRENQLLIIKTESGVFERLHQLIGFENAFIAMYEEPEAFKELMEAITVFRIDFYKQVIKYYHPDLLLVMDDLGSQRGPLLSMELYREFIKPYDTRVIRAIKELGVKVAYHSCGCMQAFIGDIIEMGADLIHPLQGGINDQEKVLKEYGNRISVIGALDNLVHLETSSEEALRKEMRRVMNLFWDTKNLIVFPASYAPANISILKDEARAIKAEKLSGN